MARPQLKFGGLATSIEKDIVVWSVGVTEYWLRPR